MSVRIAPSLLSCDFTRIGEEIDEVTRAGAELLHLDIMDGHFVPNLTFGPPVVRSLAGVCRLPLDAHLMVTDPDPLIPELAAARVARVAVHVETCPHLQRTLTSIRRLGMAAGVAVNPSTSLALIDEALAWVEFVLVMSVNPGFGGQAFIPESVGKVGRLRALLGEGIDVTVDGGVDPTTAGPLAAAGATTLVAGSAIFGSDDRSRAVAELRRAAMEAVPA